MTLSTQAREYMAMRDELGKVRTNLIDYVFAELYGFAKQEGIKLATDDRAAELEAALIKFLIDSRN